MVVIINLAQVLQQKDKPISTTHSISPNVSSTGLVPRFGSGSLGFDSRLDHHTGSKKNTWKENATPLCSDTCKWINFLIFSDDYKR